MSKTIQIGDGTFTKENVKPVRTEKELKTLRVVATSVLVVAQVVLLFTVANPFISGITLVLSVLIVEDINKDLKKSA